MKPAKIQADIDKWAKSEETKPRRGRCYSCSHPSVKQIDAAASHFIRRRNEGATSLTWGAFFNQWVKERFKDFQGTPASLRHHMEKCRGAKIK